MRYPTLLLFLGLHISSITAQSSTYVISFDNAVHHEADISATFNEIVEDTLSLRMSRTSPGRYALHEFAKNVYNLKAFDSKGDALPISKNNPYEWLVPKHDGTVKITYTLYALSLIHI